MRDVTAVILSPAPFGRVPQGVAVVNHVSTFSDMAGLLDAYFTAALKVRTPFFFFLDWDDELPKDYLSVLDECMAADQPLAYTMEMVHTSGDRWLRNPGPYSLDRLKQDGTLIHHLAVCRTADAHEVIAGLPRGTYAMEPLLYSQLAARGWAFVPRVGYIWNKHATGMHRHPTTIRCHVNVQRWLRRAAPT